MVMIPHQAKGKDTKLKFVLYLLQQAKKDPSIGVIHKNRSLLHSPVIYVIERTLKLHSFSSWHSCLEGARPLLLPTIQDGKGRHFRSKK